MKPVGKHVWSHACLSAQRRSSMDLAVAEGDGDAAAAASEEDDSLDESGDEADLHAESKGEVSCGRSIAMGDTCH
jgi:hypothetical protein